MKDIFQDPEFDQALYGGVRDLEEKVGMIVYKIFKSFDFLKTEWSCQGHAAKSHDGFSTRREGYYVYSSGLMKFRYEPESGKAKRFMADLEGLIKNYPFANLREAYKMPKEERTSVSYWLELEMKDLVEPTRPEVQEVVEFLRSQILPIFTPSPEREVRIELAEERLKQFNQFWIELEALVDGHA